MRVTAPVRPCQCPAHSLQRPTHAQLRAGLIGATGAVPPPVVGGEIPLTDGQAETDFDAPFVVPPGSQLRQSTAVSSIMRVSRRAAPSENPNAFAATVARISSVVSSMTLTDRRTSRADWSSSGVGGRRRIMGPSSPAVIESSVRGARDGTLRESTAQLARVEREE